MANPGFLFGGNTPWTYEQLQRKRKIAEQLAQANSQTPRNVGEGLAAIGRALGYRGITRRADAREAELRSGFDGRMSELAALLSGSAGGATGGGAGPAGMSPENRQAAWDTAVSWNPTQPTMPAEQPISETPLDAQGQPVAVSESLRTATSGQSDMDRANNGAQRAPDALQLAAQQLGMDENAQRAALQSYMADGGVNLDPSVAAWCAAYINSTMEQAGQPTTGSNMARSFENWGQPVDTPQRGDVVTFERGAPGSGFGHVGMVNAVGPNGQIDLLGGNQGDSVSIQSRNAGDATAIRRGYGGGAVGPMPQSQGGVIPQQVQAQLQGVPRSALPAPPQGQPQAAGGQPSIQQIIELMNDPMATDAQRQWLGGLLEQRMNPQAPEMPAAVQALEYRAQQAGLEPGTEQYRQFMLNNGAGGGVTYRQVTGAELGLGGDEATAIYNIGTDGRVTKVGGSGVTVNTGDAADLPDAALRKRLMEKVGEAWADAGVAGSAAARAMPDLNTLQELAALAPSGPITGRLAEMYPEFNDVSAVRQAIIKRVAPTLRAEGSGSTSDIEYNGMIEGMGRLINSPEANSAIISIMQAKAQFDIDRANIVREYSQDAITYAEAADRMAELENGSQIPEMVQALIRANDGSVAPAAAEGAAGESDEELVQRYLGGS